MVEPGRLLSWRMMSSDWCFASSLHIQIQQMSNFLKYDNGTAAKNSSAYNNRALGWEHLHARGVNTYCWFPRDHASFWQRKQGHLNTSTQNHPKGTMSQRRYLPSLFPQFQRIWVMVIRVTEVGVGWACASARWVGGRMGNTGEGSPVMLTYIRIRFSQEISTWRNLQRGSDDMGGRRLSGEFQGWEQKQKE